MLVDILNDIFGQFLHISGECISQQEESESVSVMQHSRMEYRKCVSLADGTGDG